MTDLTSVAPTIAVKKPVSIQKFEVANEQDWVTWAYYNDACQEGDFKRPSENLDWARELAGLSTAEE